MVTLQKRRFDKTNMPQLAKQQPSGYCQFVGSVMFSCLLTTFGPAYSSELQPISDASTTTQDPRQQLLDQMQDYRDREAARTFELQRAKEAAAKRASDARARQLERELRMWPQYGSIRVYWPGWSYDNKTRSWLTLTRPADKLEIPKSIAAALPAPSTEKAWVMVRDSVTIDDLSSKLRVSGERLAALNDVETTHQFLQGDWLVVPAKQVSLVKLLASLDPSELRRTPPLQDIHALENGPAVRLGDTIKKIAQRYGVTLQQLLQLNPGLDTAKLVVGSESSNFQPAPSRSGPPDPLRPDPAQLSSKPPARFDASLDALVVDGVLMPSECDRIRSGGGVTPFNVPAHPQACSNGSLSEQECRTGLVVRWGARGKASSNKSTYKHQSTPPTPSVVAVDCTALMLNLKPYNSPYTGWFRPIKYSFEESLVVDFCTSQISKTRT